MRATVAYIRVSTTRQETEQQRREIETAAAVRGLKIARWYDETVTGRSLKRPELQRLRADARAGRVEVLIVWALDRLSRVGILDSLILMRELEAECGVTVLSLKDGLPEPGNEFRDVALAWLFWVAAQESKRRSERVKAALNLRRERGVRLGRPSVPVDVPRALELREAGRSWRSIARGMKVHLRTLRRAVAKTTGGVLPGSHRPGRGSGA